MKLGLIADIHERAEHLRVALRTFRAEHVDQVVVIGDVFEMGQRIEETCRLLIEAHAVGVWGNHDFGLAVNDVDPTRPKYSDRVVRFMRSLRPRLLIEDCHFCHIEPWLDPEDLNDLWYFDGLPETQDRIARIFAAVSSRRLFSGHYHRWLYATPHRLMPWRGEGAVSLASGRSFVVVDALCEGHYAVFDTESAQLAPFHVS